MKYTKNKILLLLLLIGSGISAQVYVKSGTRILQNQDTYLICKNGMTIKSGSQIDLYGYTTIEDQLSNEAGSSALIVHSANWGNGNASLIQASASVPATVQRYIPDMKFHYISSPVSNQSIIPEFVLLYGSQVEVTQSFYYYDEPNALWRSIKNDDGTYNDTFDDEMNPTKGYTLSYTTGEVTRSFTGYLNSGLQIANLTKTEGKGYGWNLIGNPFPASLAVNNAADDTYNLLAQNSPSLNPSFAALYIWDESDGYDGSQNDYLTVNQLSEATFISSGQAFMVKSKANNESFKFYYEHQKHHQAEFYKSTVSNDIARFTAGIQGPEGDFNQIMIGFADGLSEGLDIGYDASKLKGNPNLALYTKLVADNGEDFAIQGLPELQDSASVKLGVTAGLAGQYSISAISTKGLPLYTKVFLEDKEQNNYTELSAVTSYSFSLPNSGTYDDRFVLHFLKDATSIEENSAEGIAFHAWTNGNQLCVRNNSDKDFRGIVRLFSASGQLLQIEEISVYCNESIGIKSVLSSGIYLLHISNEEMNQTIKIIIH